MCSPCEGFFCTSRTFVETYHFAGISQGHAQAEFEEDFGVRTFVGTYHFAGISQGHAQAEFEEDFGVY